MTDERAALLITAYADGLRRELALLGASEITDSVSEIVAMLRDASEGDPEVVAAEIENLGPPEELARTILEQHGLHTGPGTPAPSWWRLGVAAPIDILVGLALPISSAFFAVALAVGSAGSETEYVIKMGLSALAIVGSVITAIVAWRYWEPWREGGTHNTIGMTIAGISVVRVGSTRTIALTSDLKAAGLAHGGRNRIAATLVAVVTFLILASALTFLVQSADTGYPKVSVLAGDTASQQEQVRSRLDGFYQGLIANPTPDAAWVADYVGVNGMDAPQMRSVIADMATPAFLSYTVRSIDSPEPGVWVVKVDEKRAGGIRAMTVTVGLRTQWGPGYLMPTWTVIDYKHG